MTREVTIYDIAEKLHISATTVSRALNNNPVINSKTREKIQQTARELGYRHNTIASNLRKQQSKTIGVLLHEVNSNFSTSVLAGIEKIASKEQYDLLITHSAEDGTKEKANTKNLLNKRVDGLIVSLAMNTDDYDHFNLFFERKIPVVFFDRVISNSKCTKVVIDNFKCGYDATMHLIKNGHRKIAHITANLTRNVYSDRFEGYKKALQDKRITFDENLVKVSTLDKEDTIKDVEDLLKLKPDAFFITNDFAAAVCINLLRQKKYKVPQDIAVFGFNNDVLCDIVTPQLTTIDYPGMQMGEIAAKELIRQIKSNKIPSKTKTITIPSKMIIRESA